MNVQGPLPAVFRPLVGGAAAAPAPAGASPSAEPAASAANAPGGAAHETTLWDVLTADEREFFAQQAQLGAVTYRPAHAAAATPAAPIGQRIDVRG